MSYQQGSYSLGNGVNTATISFNSAFTAAPDIIIPVVDNVSGDDPKELIKAHVTAKTNNNFTVALSGDTNTNNYTLNWIAGSPTLLYDTIQLTGKKISELSNLTEALNDADYFPIVQRMPVASTKRILWSSVKGSLIPRQSTPPTGPNDAGTAYSIAVDADYLYIHNGTNWLRIPKSGVSDWGTSDVLPSHEALVALSSGAQVIGVTYPSDTFAIGAVPVISWSIVNTLDTNKLILGGIITASSRTGFNITLTTPTDSANYSLYYHAKVLP